MGLQLQLEPTIGNYDYEFLSNSAPFWQKDVTHKSNVLTEGCNPIKAMFWQKDVTHKSNVLTEGCNP